MKAIVAANGFGAASLGVALLAAVLIYSIFTGRKLPLITGDRWLFVALWVIGLTMSILAGNRDAPGTGGAPDASVLSWTLQPLMALGIAAMAMLPLVLLGLKLPPILGVSGELAALSGIIVIKWVLAHLHFLG